MFYWLLTPVIYLKVVLGRQHLGSCCFTLSLHYFVYILNFNKHLHFMKTVKNFQKKIGSFLQHNWTLNRRSWIKHQFWLLKNSCGIVQICELCMLKIVKFSLNFGLGMELQKKQLFETADSKSLIQVRILLVYDKPGEYQKNVKQTLLQGSNLFFHIWFFNLVGGRGSFSAPNTVSIVISRLRTLTGWDH